MHAFACRLLVAALLVSAGPPAAIGQPFESPPEPPAFPFQAEPALVSVADILSFRALPGYHEPDWITRNFVAAGRLPPVAERLPIEPLVYETGNLPDGIGVYGDVLRHVTGGRPEGWNFMAGQSQGWGGIDVGMMECLTRTGPLFQVRPTELEPLPNLARSWEWSADGHQLTMHLIEGARWSDGAPFTTEDALFYWEDHVLDPLLTPLLGTTQETFGAGTTLEALDDFTLRWHFATAFPKQYLFEMAYGNFCPGPAHILKPLHPRYNPASSYEAYRNALPPDYLNMPVMGAWVPVQYRPDDIIVMRRNPYYWKVDAAGNQLPYLDEIHYALTSWEDRDVRAIAGSADISGMDHPENFGEALRLADAPGAPAALRFGPRTTGYSLLFNLSANGWGEPDARAEAVRQLNRNLDFRIAVTSALDRQRLGEALVKGPFTAIYPGGLLAGTPYYDAASTAYFPFSPATAAAHFAKAGLTDRDGDGFVNWPDGTLDGANVVIVLLAPADSITERSLAEGVAEQLNSAGLRVVLKLLSSTSRTALAAAGAFDWHLAANDTELVVVVQGTAQLAPIGPHVHRQHQAGADGSLDLLPVEQELVGIVRAFIDTNDPARRVELMRRYQRVYTENVYGIGLTQYPAALIINKRFANVPRGTPVLMFNYFEDNIMRERLYVPRDRQADFELYPMSLPGPPGSGGPIN